MASLTVYDRTGSEVGKVDVEPADIAPKISRQLLHDAVVMYQANQRQGSAKTKSRSEVSGSTHKMYRQKGTGNARAGSRRSGLRRGGGHIFARRPREYSYRLPRKAVQMATRMAIASKIRDDEVVVIDALAFDAPATKDMAAILKALGLQKRILPPASVRRSMKPHLITGASEANAPQAVPPSGTVKNLIDNVSSYISLSTKMLNHSNNEE